MVLLQNTYSSCTWVGYGWIETFLQLVSNVLCPHTGTVFWDRKTTLPFQSFTHEDCIVHRPVTTITRPIRRATKRFASKAAVSIIIKAMPTAPNRQRGTSFVTS